MAYGLLFFFSPPVVKIPGVKTKNKTAVLEWRRCLLQPKKSHERIELKRWRSTLICWNKNWPSSCSLERSEISAPDHQQTICGAIHWPMGFDRHWLKVVSCRQFGVFLTLPVCSLFSSRSRRWTGSCHIWVGLDTVVQTVTSQAKRLPPRQRTRVQPSGRFPSFRARPAGSFFTESVANESFKAWCLRSRSQQP